MTTQVLGTIREFKTKNFTVIVDAIEEYDMDLSWDESGETLQKLQSGEYIGFCARVRVIHNILGEMGCDYLGGCVYSALKDFEDHRQCGKENRIRREAQPISQKGVSAMCGSYFADMIKEAIDDARRNIEIAQHIKIRV